MVFIYKSYKGHSIYIHTYIYKEHPTIIMVKGMNVWLQFLTSSFANKHQPIMQARLCPNRTVVEATFHPFQHHLKETILFFHVVATHIHTYLPMFTEIFYMNLYKKYNKIYISLYFFLSFFSKGHLRKRTISHHTF